MQENKLTEVISTFRVETATKRKLTERANKEGRTLVNLIQLILRNEANKDA